MDSLALLDLLNQFPLREKPTLGALSDLLKKLGDPQKEIPPVIHVAGTNGKGSVSAFLDSCLQASGLRVHRYTSPHLVSYTERIHICGIPIAEDTLYDLLSLCYRKGGTSISPFEALTAAAFLAFAQNPADVAVIEVGLGGTFDATNLVETTKASVITPISYDHQDILGSTLTQIAKEKAGIMRPLQPCIISQQKPIVMRTLLKAAPEETPCLRFGKDWSVQPSTENGFYFWWKKNRFHYQAPSLIGDHQAVNAGTAIATLCTQTTWTISQEAIQEGLIHAVWPARCQQVSEEKVLSCFPKHWEIWIDGAHNPAGAEVMRHHILNYWQDRPLILVIGMLEKKDSTSFWNLLAPLATCCYTFSGFDPHALPKEIFLNHAERTNTPIVTLSSLEELPSYMKLQALHDVSARVLFCGSLYFLGYVIRHYGIPLRSASRSIKRSFV